MPQPRLRSERLARAIVPLLSLGLGLGVGMTGAIAQTVNADGTVGTTVTGTNPFTITGGTIQGTNLFHSFSDFSPGTAATTFDLTAGSYGGTANGITAIINRVTGSTVSNIDGILEVLGGADPDFFLINPNGIIFGPNAELRLDGSFIGSTASSITFTDKVEFAADDTTVAPLLTVNRPLGLQMGSNPSTIEVNDLGHDLVRTTFFNPTDRTQLMTSPLQVATGETLALIGGDVTLNGGVLMAEAGHGELGAAHNSTVELAPSTTGWRFDYGAVQTFGEVNLVEQALVDVSSNLATGASAGSASLRGAAITLDDGSLVLSQNVGNQAGGGIQVSATDTILVQGVDPSTNAHSSLRTEGFGFGSSGAIALTTRHLDIRNEGSFQTLTFGPGSASGAVIDAETASLRNGSVVGSISFGDGNAENVTIKAKTLNVLDGSILGSFTLNNPFSPGNDGAAGDVQVTADVINVQGANAVFASAGGIGSVSFGPGAGGNINVNAARIDISDGGRISTEIAHSGAAGNLNIIATEQIVVRDTPATGEETGIFASGKIQTAFTQMFFDLPAAPTGRSGNINLQTPYLEISQGGSVNARHEGTGDSGNVRIESNVVYLNEGGNISTATASGEGGAIDLQIRDLLLLRRGSFISTEAGGTGNGGNIAIAAPVIAGYENSDIIANAFQGNGGNINITTQGIFGLVFREQLTPENDITASSQFGLNGTFTVNEFSLDPSSGLVALAAALRDASDQVASTCSTASQSEFIATGRGGIPPSPNAQSSDRPWQDTRDLSAFLDRTTTPLPPSNPPAATHIQEATGFGTLANGQMALVARSAPASTDQPYATCAVNPGG